MRAKPPRKRKNNNLPPYVPTPEQIARECAIIRSTSFRNNSHHDNQLLSDSFDDTPGIREYFHQDVMGRMPMPDGPELCDNDYWNQEKETLGC